MKTLFLLAASLCFSPFLAGQNASPPPTAEAIALHAFFEAEWNYEMEQNPTRASSLGDRRWNDRWGDNSQEAIPEK